jgi:NarL family two-component system response regulator LiaR
MTADNLINVVHVDDHFEILRIVQALLAATEDICLVGQYANGQKGIEQSNHQDHESVYAMLLNGAVGYLTKTPLAEDLAETIRTALQDKLFLSPKVGEHLMKPPYPSNDFQLTDRKLEVLMLMTEGLTNQQAALELSNIQSTLKFHNAIIYRKLDVQTRSEALVLAANNNLI